MKFFRPVQRTNNRSTMLAGVATVSFALFSACASGDADVDPAVSEPASAEVDLVVSDDPAVIKRGRIIFLQCRACHSLNEGGEHKVGPNLHGLLGATIGSKPAFNYSATLADNSNKWTAARLNEFLTKPSDAMPGTIMAFAGLSKAEDRTAIIAYLADATK